VFDEEHPLLQKNVAKRDEKPDEAFPVSVYSVTDVRYTSHSYLKCQLFHMRTDMRFGETQPLAYGAVPAASASVQERMIFLKKVYGLLTASLLTATIGAYLASGPLFEVMVGLHMPLFILEIGLIFFVMYAARKPGLNLIALFSFTTVSGLTLGPLLGLYIMAGKSTIIAEAFALTTVVFLGLTAYVIFSRRDFSFMGGFLLTGLIIVLVGGLINMFVGSSLFSFLISGVSVFLFSGFILYDTSNILRHYSTDDYVNATLALYLDVFNLFIALLNILGLSRD
jgi:modulator of FtsH protease